MSWLRRAWRRLVKADEIAVAVYVQRRTENRLTIAEKQAEQAAEDAKLVEEWRGFGRFGDTFHTYFEQPRYVTDPARAEREVRVLLAGASSLASHLRG